MNTGPIDRHFRRFWAVPPAQNGCGIASHRGIAAQSTALGARGARPPSVPEAGRPA